jgi:ankyrin repeat protein
MSNTAPAQQNSRPRFQFSLGWLFVVTAIAASATACIVALERRAAEAGRTRALEYAIFTGNLADVNRLLKLDPTLARGFEHGTARSSLTALQQALLSFHKAKGAAIVDRILKEHPDVNEQSQTGETAIAIAVRQGLVAEVQKLLRLGADVNLPDAQGRTPLHIATETDRTGTVVQMLLNAGSRVDDNNNLGQTALHIALAANNRPVVMSLLSHGAAMTVKDGRGRVPGEQSDGILADLAFSLWWDAIEKSVSANDPARLRSLFARDPLVIRFRTKSGINLFHRAMAAKRLDILDRLLAYRGNALPELAELPPLHDACWHSEPVQKTKQLLDAGADVNARDPFGQTPLHAAAREHNRAVLKLLLQRGAEITAVDYAGTTVLDSAFERSFVLPDDRETIDVLIKNGHPPTVLYAAAIGDLDLLQKLTNGNSALLNRVYTRTGARPLHAAIMGNQPKVIEWLFEHGVEREPLIRLDWRASYEHTPLMRALSYHLNEIAILLIERDANVNRDASYIYPAHAVIKWDLDPTLLQILLEHGADPLLSCQEQTAFDLANASRSQHRNRYLELLDQAMRKPDGACP